MNADRTDPRGSTHFFFCLDPRKSVKSVFLHVLFRRSRMTTFPTLFSPLRIGPRPVKTRTCCSAHADALAEDGMPTERTVRYYEMKARGGAGLIMCFGSASVHPTSPARDWNGVELFEDRVI